jgi:hypothetical protein
VMVRRGVQLVEREVLNLLLLSVSDPLMPN